MGEKRNFTSVSIPSEIAEKIDKLIGVEGYRSRADVVNDAVRRLLEKLEGEKRA